MKVFQLRRQKLTEANLRRQIGAGQSYKYFLNGEAGQLRLQLLAENTLPSATRSISCSIGILHLSELEAVCSLLSNCPLIPSVQAEDSWYWPLFNQSVSEEIHNLLGNLEWHSGGSLDDEGLSLSLSVRLGEQHAESLIHLSLNSLSLLLKKDGWRPVAYPPMAQLAFTLPFVLGTLSCSLEELRHLQRNDVVLPTTTYISPSGKGILRIAKLGLKGELLSETGHCAYFYINDLETLDVNATPDDYTMDDMRINHEQSDDTVYQESTAFDSLPLALTVRCGHLKLTLSELNRLSVGSTLIVEHVKPGEAILCHGDFTLAKGELVDVEGQLGLQVTHMLPGAAKPLDNIR